MEKRSKILILVIAIVLVVGSIGAYYGYQYYTNQKFDESFKSHYYNSYKAIEYANASIDSTLYYNQHDWEVSKNNSVENLNKAIDYQKKAISYEEDMVKYSPNSAYKNYSEYLLETNKDALKQMELRLQLYNIFVYPAVYTDQAKADQLLKKINDLNDDAESLNDKKDKIKLDNPDLNKRIDDLSNETQSVLQ